MGGGFQFLDIILFAMIAAFLVVRLHRVLGKRTGHERQHETVKREAEEVKDTVVHLPERRRATSESRHPAAAGLAQIKIADPNFDEDEFLAGAKTAFEYIVSAFAAGDKAQLRSLLADDLFASFVEEIDRRAGAGETQKTTITSIDGISILEAEMADRDAVVTVKIESQQINVTLDTEGRVIAGDPNDSEEVTDIWTFSRNTRSRDPNWALVKTRSPA
ncbi:MAG: translocase [Rhodospirillaceae bacterium]|nr:translocase [Rhodospirillaceae bacterium]